MSPRMEPDFDWSGVQASTPIFKKGDYQLTIYKVRGSAWPKKDEQGNPTKNITQVVKLRPKMVGVYDSNGKLKSEQNGKAIKDVVCEEINFWVHSEGGRKMAKQQMMAVLGYNPNDQVEEDKFNAFLKKSNADLSFEAVEREDGSGWNLNIGDGWEKMFAGKNVRAHMDEESRESDGRTIVSQNYVRLSPVNPL